MNKFQERLSEIEHDLKRSPYLISSASAGINYVDSVNQTHGKMWEIIKMMEEHIDGKKPVDQRKLESKGRGWVNNWNYGKARSKLEKTTAENVSTIMNSIFMMEVDFKKPTKAQEENELYAWMLNDEIRDAVAMIIEAATMSIIDLDVRLIEFFNQIEYNTTTWGWCPVIIDKVNDWMGAPQSIRSIGFPKKVRPENVKSFCIMDTKEADDLWKRWLSVNNDPDNISMERYGISGDVYHKHISGWIKEGLEECLYWSLDHEAIKSKDGNKDLFNKFEDVLPSFATDPGSVMKATDSVNIAIIFAEEMGGGVTKTILAYGNGWKGREMEGRVVRSSGSVFTPTEYTPSHLIYQEKIIGVDSISEVIKFVFDSGFSTDGSIQAMRGLARLAVEDSIRFNRKKNSIENKMVFAGAPVLRKTSIGTGDAGPKVMPSHGFTLISEGYDFMEKQPNFDLSSQIASIQLDEAHYDRETFHFDPSLSGRLSSRPVTAEVDAKSSEVRRVEGSKINIKLKCYADIIYYMLLSIAEHIGESSINKYSDASEEVFRSFVDMLIDDLSIYNIDNEDKIKKVLNMIGAVRISKVNSDTEAIQEQLMSATTPYRRLKLNRMLALARGFSRSDVEILHPIQPKVDSLDRTKMAAAENILLKFSSEVVFSPNDDHLGDLDIHLPKCFALVDMIQQGGIDPVEGYNWFARIMEHSGMHVDALLKLPYILDAIKEKYLSNFSDLMKIQVGLNTMVQQYAKQLAEQQQQAEQQQAEQGQQVDPKVQAKIQMDWAQLESRESIAAARSKFREEEKRKDNELKRRIKEEDHLDKKKRQQEIHELKQGITMMQAQLKGLAQNS